MKRTLFLALLIMVRCAVAQTGPSATVQAPLIPQPATNSSSAKPAPKLSRTAMTAAELQKTVDQLTQSNRDLLDLLKQQQEVLEDMQFEHRKDSRLIESLEEEMTETRLKNGQLENKISNLESEASVRPPVALQHPPLPEPPQEMTISNEAPVPANPGLTNTAANQTEPPPLPPDTYLPAPDTEGMPGTKSWHRLFTLKGGDNKQSDPFHIEGRTWRVIWHNQDPPGKNLKGTSGLFIDAFPKDDSIPQHVCAKVGTGDEKSELIGPGDFYLKITASGGSWELAVEDFK
jgi:hypothetical protein